MVFCDDELEEIAVAALEDARLATDRPPDPVRLARRVVGPVVTLPARGLPPAAFLARYNGTLHVCVRGRLPTLALAWSICHEVAEHLLQRRSYRAPDVETVANRLAACLRAPRPFAARQCEKRGPEWGQLALDFGSSETCAALRFGEVTGTPVALVSSERTRFRGNWLRGYPEESALRAPTKLKGLVKARLGDDRSRVVVLPERDVG